MKEKFNKVALVISILTGLVAIVFGILDLMNIWEKAYTFASCLFAVSIGLQAIISWNEKRKTAIVELVVAAVLFVLAIVNIIF